MERDKINYVIKDNFIISTHTLTWSVTLIIPFIGFSPMNFNSHAHVERDNFFMLPKIYSYISTHTLTWSVTNGLRSE